MVQIVVAVGGNVGDVRQTLRRAQEFAAEHGSVRGLRSAGLYRTVAMGADAGDSFLNSAWVFETSLAPLELLDLLQHVEDELGRTREVRWGPRTLDLDLIFYGNQRIDLPRLSVPHPHCWYRQFVLAPVVSLVPDFVHPILGLTTQQLLERLLADQVSIGYAGKLAGETRLGELVAEFPNVVFSAVAAHSLNEVPDEALAFWFGRSEYKPESPFWLQVPYEDGLQFVRDVLTAACVGVELA